MDAQYLYILLPAILLIEGAFIGFASLQFNTSASVREGAGRLLRGLYGNRAGMAVLVVVWLLLTAVVFWYEFFIALVVLYLLLFSFGRLVAGIGLVAFGALFLATPVACAWLMLRLGRQYRRPPAAGPREAGFAGMDRRRPVMPGA